MRLWEVLPGFGKLWEALEGSAGFARFCKASEALLGSLERLRKALGDFVT